MSEQECGRGPVAITPLPLMTLRSIAESIRAAQGCSPITAGAEQAEAEHACSIYTCFPPP